MNPFTFIEMSLGADAELRREALALAAARPPEARRSRRLRAALRRIVGLRPTAA